MDPGERSVINRAREWCDELCERASDGNCDLYDIFHSDSIPALCRLLDSYNLPSVPKQPAPLRAWLIANGFEPSDEATWVDLAEMAIKLRLRLFGLGRTPRNDGDCSKPDGDRKTIRLGKSTMKAAEQHKSVVEHLLSHQVSGLAMDPEVARMVGSITEPIRDRYERSGLTGAQETEHHQGHESRAVPLLPAIEVELLKLFAEAATGGSGSHCFACCFG